jgi:hypothetical protein
LGVDLAELRIPVGVAVALLGVCGCLADCNTEIVQDPDSVPIHIFGAEARPTSTWCSIE